MDANTAKILEVILSILPAVAPKIVDLIKKLKPELMAKAPWLLKPALSIAISALLAWLSSYAVDVSVVTAAGASIAGPVGYYLARNKEPK